MKQRHLIVSISLIAMLIQFIPTASSSGLGAPSLVAPAANSLLSDNTPTFRWTSVAGADNYTLQCSTDNTFPAASTITVDNIRGNTIELALGDGTYYWRVRAGRDNGDVGPWSSVWSFTLDTQPPAPPALISPENDSYVRDATLEFSWSTVSGARNYRFLFADNPDFSSPMRNVILTESRYTMSLPADGRYYWKVASRDSVGNQAYSQTWIVTVDNRAPMAPSLLSPADGENVNDNTPLLTWGAALDNFGIENYEIWIDGSLSRVVTDNARTSENAPELAYGLHRWRVRVFDHAGNENSSPEYSFFVDTVPPPQPSKLAPTNGEATTSNMVTFRWSSVSDRGFPAACYELWVDDDPEFGSPSILENVVANSRTREVADGRYFWRVRAYDSAGNASSFENSWSLLVDNTPPPKPSLIWPEEGVEENTSSPTFEWAPVEDVSSVTYELQIADNNNFLSPVYYATLLSGTQCKIENTLPDDNYYWRVRARDEFGRFGEWSDNVRFQVILRDFTIAVSPTGGSARQGDQVTAMIVLTKIGSYSHLVNLSVSGQPAGVQVATDVAATPPYHSPMYIVVGEGAQPGSYILTITGSDAYGRVRTCEFLLTVYARPTAAIQKIAVGEKKVASVGKASVAEIEIGVVRGVENVAIYIEEVEEPGVAAPGPLVYSYFSVSTENISDGDLASLTIKFEVLRSWLQQGCIDQSRVRLWRYGANGWQELETQQGGEDAIRIYFSASSPGFSLFAITGERITEFPRWLALLMGVVVLVVALAIIFVFLGRGRRAELERPVEWKPVTSDFV
jgi:PGF-pre-PGF domain-containing protein